MDSGLKKIMDRVNRAELLDPKKNVDRAAVEDWLRMPTPSSRVVNDRYFVPKPGESWMATVFNQHGAVIASGRFSLGDHQVVAAVVRANRAIVHYATRIVLESTSGLRWEGDLVAPPVFLHSDKTDSIVVTLPVTHVFFDGGAAAVQGEEPTDGETLFHLEPK